MKLPKFLALLALAALLQPVLALELPKVTPEAREAAIKAPVRELNIGDQAPDFSLPGIDGKYHTLADYKDAKILIVAFISNHCPDSHAAEGRIKKLLNATKDLGVSLVAINPNNPEGLSIDEIGYSKYGDSYEDMIKYAAEAGFTFPYLYDGDTQLVAKAYGCLATPHIFIFDEERKLRYKGQFDDSRFADPRTVRFTDTQNAVMALLGGQEVKVTVTRPHGCSTKWLTKQDGISQKMEAWDKTPVDLEDLDAAGVAKLRKKGVNGVRLINVWSTTCAPCVVEFPELVLTARKFDTREFQFINISTDLPEDAAKAKAFLEKRGAGLSAHKKGAVKAEGRTTNSYHYQGADVGALMKEIDPEWPGGFPHTVMIGKDGEILWRHNGMVNGDELRAKVLEQLGPYYQP